MQRLFAITLATCSLLVLAGCSASVSVGESQKDKLEEIIATQLPGEAKATLGEIEVASTNCVERESSAGKTSYDCIAKVTGTNSDGTPGSRSIPITASCDSSDCVWKTR